MVPFESLSTVSYSHSSCIISEINARYWSTIAIFHSPFAFDASARGPRRNIAITFGTEKVE